ncbi:unnamed protein product, partial [Brachionus calyciflorus]
MKIDKQETKKTKKREEILGIINNWALSTTAHGFGNIARAEKKLLKLIWLCFLILSIGYCTYQVVSYIIRYCQFNVTSSSKIIYEEPTNFPSIVICNINSYDGSEVRNFTDQILFEKNISLDDYEPVDFVQRAADYFKSTFEALALQNKFNLYFNG